MAGTNAGDHRAGVPERRVADRRSTTTSTWRGTLTDIVGGYGYWVQTTAFESISTLIPETDTSSILPTAKVIKGWNLLGVVDVAAGRCPGDPPVGENAKWRG